MTEKDETRTYNESGLFYNTLSFIILVSFAVFDLIIWNLAIT